MRSTLVSSMHRIPVLDIGLVRPEPFTFRLATRAANVFYQHLARGVLCVAVAAVVTHQPFLVRVLQIGMVHPMHLPFCSALEKVEEFFLLPFPADQLSAAMADFGGGLVIFACPDSSPQHHVFLFWNVLPAQVPKRGIVCSNPLLHFVCCRCMRFGH